MGPYIRYVFRRNRPWLLGVASVAIFIAIWEGAGLAGWLNPVFMASPSSVGNHLLILLKSERLLNDFLVTMNKFGQGFLLSIMVGMSIGLLMGLFQNLAFSLSPFIMGLYAIPYLAYTPLVIMWFGYGMFPKILIVFLAAFFPICINTWEGVRTVDPLLVNAARIYGANKGQIVTKIILPYTLPFVVTGLRMGVGRGLTAAFVAELWGASSGLGYMTVTAANRFNAPVVFLGIIIFAVVGISLTEVMRFFERRASAWRGREAIV